MRLSRALGARSVLGMMPIDRPVTILGLGRMGAAMASAFQEHGWLVTAWNRSPTRLPGGIEPANDVTEAVADAQLVVLCLFDFDACRAVLESCASELSPGALVINTSTIGPDEAPRLARLVQEAGARYVHAPVLGSVPAVRSGRLLVLAGGDPLDVDRARDALAVVSREVRHVGDPARAAALKLVANASLAGALIALRDVMEAAAALGLDVETTLDVLAAGQLGGLSEAKRDLLTAEPHDADFTIRALLKDLTLLRAATASDLHVQREIAVLVEDGHVDQSDDIAAVFLLAPSRAAAAS